jgi:hypothetical protein
MTPIYLSLTLAVLLNLVIPMSLAAQARPRGDARVEGQAVPRGDAQRGAAAAPTTRPQLGVAPLPPQRTAPPAAAQLPAAPQRRAAVAPSVPARRAGAPPQTAVPRTVPRVVVPQGQVVIPNANRPRGTRNDHYVYRPDYGPNYRGYYPSYRGDRFYRPYYYPRYRPYYSFRPRFRVGFGIWVGHPVVYPYYVRPHVYPYPYTYPSAYPYPVGTPPYPVPAYPTSTTTAPANYGGLSFEITPADADVYIDGQYYGTVAQFSPSEPPLWLTPGQHRVEIREAGFESIVFAVEIVAGEVIPYQGELRRF